MFLVVAGLVSGLERERGPGVPDLELKGLRRVWMRLFRTRMIWLVEQRRARNIRLTLCAGSSFAANLFMIGELLLSGSSVLLFYWSGNWSSETWNCLPRGVLLVSKMKCGLHTWTCSSEWISLIFCNQLFFCCYNFLWRYKWHIALVLDMQHNDSVFVGTVKYSLP